MNSQLRRKPFAVRFSERGGPLKLSLLRFEEFAEANEYAVSLKTNGALRCSIVKLDGRRILQAFYVRLPVAKTEAVQL